MPEFHIHKPNPTLNKLQMVKRNLCKPAESGQSKHALCWQQLCLQWINRSTERGWESYAIQGYCIYKRPVWSFFTFWSANAKTWAVSDGHCLPSKPKSEYKALPYFFSYSTVGRLDIKMWDNGEAAFFRDDEWLRLLITHSPTFTIAVISGVCIQARKQECMQQISCSAER